MQNGALKGLSTSLGMTYNSSRNGSFDDVNVGTTPTLILPAYTIVDAGIAYKLAGWGIQANVGNLFDKRYWPSAGRLTRVTVGQPRSFRLTLSRSF